MVYNGYVMVPDSGSILGAHGLDPKCMLYDLKRPYGPGSRSEAASRSGPEELLPSFAAGLGNRSAVVKTPSKGAARGF